MGNEEAAYADKAYESKERRERLHAQGVKDRIMHRGRQSISRVFRIDSGGGTGCGAELADRGDARVMQRSPKEREIGRLRASNGAGFPPTQE